ncbi:MAG: hypothetical protein ACI9JN_002877, partial [Bacteroidia bacterium]
TQFSSAQQTENHINNWCFGTGLGMTFNGGAPVKTPNNLSAE